MSFLCVKTILFLASLGKLGLSQDFFKIITYLHFFSVDEEQEEEDDSNDESNDEEEIEHIQDDFEPETKVVEEQHLKNETKRSDGSFASQFKVPDEVAPEETMSAGMKDNKFCTICNKTFKTLQNKQLHVARVHERKKAFTCPMCNESFVNKYGLERRKVRIHDKIKRYFKCDTCNKEMSTPFTLSSHKKTKNHLAKLGQ